MKCVASDLVAGYVESFDAEAGLYHVKTSAGDACDVVLTEATYAVTAANLGEDPQDATAALREGLAPGQFLYAYGIFYPDGDGATLEAKCVTLPGSAPDTFRHEEPDWWVNQIRSIGHSYLKWQFNHPDDTIDFARYRTALHLAGAKQGDRLQETDTISRFVYGMASAYMLTGEDAFLEGAEKGTAYLRDHVRFYDPDEDLIYWYHGVKVSGDREQKLLTSEFGDDFDSIPAYEQIYALAGPVQTYRLTGDPRILRDAEQTIDLFDAFYKDNIGGGFFSHIDPIGLDPRAETLEKGNNRAKKNWNSVGDHAPAYLINLWLATGEKRYANFLEYTYDTIEAHFQDYDNSPFVQERFFEDWSPDRTWGWQQDRAVVGHNLKIAWNLMRMNSLTAKESYVTFARKIAELMPPVGSDLLRGGWYDVVERTLEPGQTQHRHVWHDRKAWWQQEQAILAYMILHGCLGDETYLKHAREAAAFYNTFFLDHDDGAVYFNVLANGMPYLLGTERFKGSHSMSAYHSTELCFLAAVYTNLLIKKGTLDLYFKPRPDGFKDRLLRVAPDILPAGSVALTAVEIEGKPHTDFDADTLVVRLPDSESDLHVKVQLTGQ